MPRFKQANQLPNAVGASPKGTCKSPKSIGPSDLGFEARLWAAADALHNIIDCTSSDNVRAQLRVVVTRTLRKYGYLPDKQERATQTVLEQAEIFSDEWAKRSAA